MQLAGSNGLTIVPARRWCAALLRVAPALVLVSMLGWALASPAGADKRTTGPQTTGASNGGIATASSGGNISIGTIVTGENYGNSITTGDITGPAEISGGEIDYPTEVNVTQNIGPPIATADGGDGGQASGPSLEPPELDVNIDNTDKNRNDNRSTATGIGEGGAGGAGGAGGDVTINDGNAP